MSPRAVRSYAGGPAAATSSTDVGWSEYDYTGESWSTASYESYAEDTVADARSRIRSTVLGN